MIPKNTRKEKVPCSKKTIYPGKAKKVLFASEINKFLFDLPF